MKKIIALLLAAVMLPCTAFAEETEQETEVQVVSADERYDMLSALGIIKNYKDCADFYDIPYVSRGEFCSMIAGVLTDDVPNSGESCTLTDIAESEYKDGISYLWEKNIVSGTGDNEFSPELALTVEQALIVAVKALGYNFYVDNFAGETYISTAQKFGFADGIGGDYSEALEKDKLLTLMENIIDIEPFGVDMTEDNTFVFGTHKKGTVLEVYRRIYTDEGIMTSDVYTDGLRVKTDPKGTIEVNNTVYDNNPCQDKSEFLGMDVKLWYKSENGDKTALYVKPRDNKNKSVTIEEKNIDNVTAQRVEYRYGEKEKNMKISRALKVIYNGAAYLDYDIEDLKPKYGSLRLLDNNGDGTAEYAFVTSYELMWLDRYSALEKKIYNKLESGIDEISVLDPDVERSLYIEKDGEKTDRFGIGSKDVLLVTRSRGEGGDIIKIYASSNTVEGTLRAKRTNEDGETEIETDDGTYLLNPLTEEALEAGDSALVSPEAGTMYKFYLDFTGRIAAFEKSSEGGELYGYLKRIYDEDDDRYACKMFTQDGEWKKLMFAERVKYNGEYIDSEKIPNIFAPGGTAALQMVRYRLIRDEIKYIRTAEESDRYRENIFTTSGLREFMYVGTSKNLGDRYFFNGDAKIFVIPTDKSAADDDYKIEGPGILKTETARYNMEVYDADDFGHSSIFKLEQSLANINENNRSNVYYVVRSISRQVDENEEIISVLDCAGDGEDKVILTGKTENVFDGLKLGDVIQVSKDRKKYVTGTEKVFSIDDVGRLSDDGEPDMYNVSIDISGYVEAVDSSRNVLKMKINENGSVYLKNPNAPNVVLIEDGKVRTGTIKDLTAGSFIAGRVGYGTINDIVIYKN